MLVGQLVQIEVFLTMTGSIHMKIFRGHLLATMRQTFLGVSEDES